MKSIITAALAVAFIGTAAEAKGIPTDFRLNASELSTPEGAAAVYARMESRANSKCDAGDNYLRRAREECAAGLVDSWVSEIGNKVLDSIHRANS